MIDPQHAAKHLVLTTQYAKFMSKNTTNLNKFIARIAKLDKEKVLLLAVQFPLHFITVATECTGDIVKLTISDSLGKF